MCVCVCVCVCVLVTGSYHVRCQKHRWENWFVQAIFKTYNRCLFKSTTGASFTLFSNIYSCGGRYLHVFYIIRFAGVICVGLSSLPPPGKSTHTCILVPPSNLPRQRKAVLSEFSHAGSQGTRSALPNNYNLQALAGEQLSESFLHLLIRWTKLKIKQRARHFTLSRKHHHTHSARECMCHDLWPRLLNGSWTYESRRDYPCTVRPYPIHTYERQWLHLKLFILVTQFICQFVSLLSSRSASRASISKERWGKLETQLSKPFFRCILKLNKNRKEMLESVETNELDNV